MGACESKENLFAPTSTTGDGAEAAEAHPSQIHINAAQKKTVEMSISLQQRIDVLPTNTLNLNMGEDGSIQTSTRNDTVTKQTLLQWKEKISELSNEIVAIEQERKAADVEHKRTVSELRRELSKARATNLAQKKLIREKEHAVSRTQSDIKEMVTAIALLKKQSLARKHQMQSISGVLHKVAGEHHSKLKFARTNKKHLIFTSKLNRLFYYEAQITQSPRSPKSPKSSEKSSTPKMMHIRSVTTRHDAIDEQMQRPWFYVVGEKRAALFVADDAKTRDVWVKFIRESLRKAPKKDPSILAGPAMSMVPFGQQQSPINLCTTKCYKLPSVDLSDGRQCSLRFHYPKSVRNCTVTNTGHTVRVNIDAKLSGNACTVTLRDKTFTLQQFHFHTPAEHTVDDALHEMEMHLVHTNAAGEIAVLGFLFSTQQKHRKPRLKLSRSRSRSRNKLRAQTMEVKTQRAEVETRARPKSLNLGAPQPRAPPSMHMHMHVVSASEISEVSEMEASEVEEVREPSVSGGDGDDEDGDEAEEAERARLNAEEDMGKFYKDYAEKKNAFLAQFWEELPTKQTAEDVPLYKALSFDALFETAASDLVKETADARCLDVEMRVFEYTGSLTTPPYTEGVQWLVAKKTHFISHKQLNKLSACWGHENNARALQKEFGRTVALRSQCTLRV